MKIETQTYPNKVTPIFSVLIPSWNNLSYLKLCVKSLRQHSSIPLQIIVHINDGSDGSLDWVKAEKIDHTHSTENIGVCWSLNAASTLAKGNYISFLNDDMYVLPHWDSILYEEIQSIGHDRFFLSSTMIEPRDTGNPCVIHANFGGDAESFQEEKLLDEFTDFEKNDWAGSSWPPNIVSKNVWEMVGGYSVEFSPGMSSDPDFSMKLWKMGIRYFKGLGKSRTYHFQARSTHRITKNNGRKQFLQKWDMTQSTFYKHYLKLGQAWEGELQSPELTSTLKLAHLKGKLKKRFT